MQNPSDLSKAIRDSIQTEKNAMDFYLLAARQTRNKDVKRFFDLLADEEKEHALSFFRHYKGKEIAHIDSFLNQPLQTESSWVKSLEKLISQPDFDERRAMELAMKKELELERQLRALSEGITDSEVKKIYLQNAEWTRNHYLLIEAEYARLMRMVDETDVDTYVRE